ncbi:4-alpha-glucanotransferase [Clostridia bacterium]|nr:4-alpha-glucanotransferase [Clostridia bacterium]
MPTKTKTKWTSSRRSGILLPIFSLPSPYGIGTFGKAAYQFLDFLKAAGQSYWQVLPLGPVGKGHSPYSSPSSFAGNPLFIDWDLLTDKGLLMPDECAALKPIEFDKIDYLRMIERSGEVLRLAFTRVTPDMVAKVERFRHSHHWAEDYALYEAIRAEDSRHWYEWPEGLKRRDPAALSTARERLRGDIAYRLFTQWLFFEQWSALKAYANVNGIAIVGDIPIYAAMDSADVWANPGLFELDEDLNPIEESGCPPDFFNADGQLWENPIYRWDVMQQDGYDWWVRRLGAVAELFDVTRIDHFRGLEAFYAIPGGETTARNGQWRPGPGYPFFETINKALGNPEVIAEDLGDITSAVKRLLKRTGYPGMKVLQFAFNPGADSEYLPHKYERNCVVYTGTHDNDTSLGYFANAPAKERRFARQYLNMGRQASVPWTMIRAAWSSTANTAIAPIQDFLELGSEARVNVPGIAEGNWSWRMKPGALTDELADKIRVLTELYGR